MSRREVEEPAHEVEIPIAGTPDRAATCLACRRSIVRAPRASGTSGRRTRGRRGRRARRRPRAGGRAAIRRASRRPRPRSAAIRIWTSSESSSSAGSRPARPQAASTLASFSRSRGRWPGREFQPSARAAITSHQASWRASPSQIGGAGRWTGFGGRSPPRSGRTGPGSRAAPRPPRARASAGCLRHARDPLGLLRPGQAVGAHLGLAPSAVVEEDQAAARERVERRRPSWPSGPGGGTAGRDGSCRA